MIIWIYKFLLNWRLKNDRGLQKSLLEADKQLDELSAKVKEVEESGIEVPSYVKKYLKK